MSEKSADSQKKLELSVSIVTAYINAHGKSHDKSKKGEKCEKNEEGSKIEPCCISDKQILDLLEKTFNKMHELSPFPDRKIGLGN